MSLYQSAIIPAASFSQYPMTMVRPTGEVGRWVQCLWQVNRVIRADMPPATGTDSSANHRINEKIYPDGGASLTFIVSSTHASAFYFHNTQVCNYHWQLSNDYLSVRLYPGAARVLLGLDVADIASHEVDLCSLTFPRKDSLLRLLDALPGQPPQHQLTLLQQWLTQLQQTPCHKPGKWMNLLSVVDQPLQPLQDLASERGISRRTLERQLRVQAGVSPKQLDMCARIRFARQQLILDQEDLSQIALQCGFYDQAHFTNVFRQHTQETPANYQQRKMAQISNR